MIVIALLSAAVLLGYFTFIYSIHKEWSNAQSYSGDAPAQRISIIICARNEEDTIRGCLDSIFRNKYPRDLIEIFVVDDHSSDNTASLIKKSFPEVEIISLVEMNIPETVNSFKKYGITTAVERAKGAIILTTDADCEVPSDWITSMVRPFANPKVNVVVGPVLVKQGYNLIGNFQLFDFAATMGATAYGIETGKFYSGAGASLAYRREAFLNKMPYRGNMAVASGDDIFLIQSLVGDKEEIAFAGKVDSSVITASEPSWHSLLLQRVRWAAKGKYYSDPTLNKIWMGVFSANVWWVILLVLTIIDVRYWIFFLIYFSTKLIIDYRLVHLVLKSFDRRMHVSHFVLSTFLYPFFLSFVVIKALTDRQGTWKGRNI